MSTIFLQNQIEGCPQYVDTDPYKTSDSKYRVSVSDNYAYDKTEIELGKNNTTSGTTYNLSNELFEDFLLNHVFRVYKNGGENPAAATTDDYTACSINVTPTEHIVPAKLKINGTDIKGTHLAGTLFTYSVVNKSATTPVNFNCALLLEETFKTDGTSISKVDIDLRMTEPLMQTLLSTTGNAYDFKKAVKISDFMDNLEQVDEVPTDPNIKYNKGFLQFRMMEPTNMSVAKDSVSTTPISAPTYPKSSTLETGESIYTKSTDESSLETPAINATSFNGDKYTAVTNFTGYFIMCTFGESVTGINKDTIDNLLSKKPYLTIIRIVHSKIVNTQFNEIFDASGLTSSGYTPSNCILNYISNTTTTDGNGEKFKSVVINVDDVGIVVPFDFALDISGALTGLEDNMIITSKFYVMTTMIDTSG